ncbi:hypothetical protein PPL_02271 [Heterostelium album PN500]|uniref:ADP-ribosylation factor n=1 Tax=Heterostelium pallidum (strain ATCC 26659 / Pp 5 / PN500) TaxID=670386 RepID=D3B1U7_HETP5|nr:hypothetical protein PPL_02271 [Heterostelium album PN500]EFA85271.1 hypothetical protein PPL_02271 [Heterostelium album PN500]|eukprot:XP_020437380.1 hypothetical protein PPL_02271 [Heterostelium album PN500]
MGGMFTKIYQLFDPRLDYKIIMIGLDGSGKTTMLYKLKLGEVVNTIPTVGFNVESVQYRNINFTVWDIGGQNSIRKLWTHYYSEVAAVIFVVDSTDVERLEEASEEIKKILAQSQLNGAVLLFLCNKQDLPQSLSMAEISDRLKLQTIRDRQWYLQPTVAIDGSGLFEGLDWMSNALRKNHHSQSSFKSYFWPFY